MSTATAATGERVTQPADGAHERFFAAGRTQLVDEHDRVLWQTLQRLTEGGKRFRPLLLSRTYAALGGEDEELAATIGEAVELLHTAFVIHDDVIDGDLVRRGRPNVGGVFSRRAAEAGASQERARNYGDAAGILAGDLALAGAVREIALSGAPPAVVVRLLDLLEGVLHRSAAGELADVRVSLTGDASLLDVLDIAEWKTAAYSFQLPLQAAAILAQAGDEVVAALEELGRSLGLAFQLRDDLDGVFGEIEQTGKDPLCDLREGKCTALITVARSTHLWDELAPYVGAPDLTAEGAVRARELLVTCGARAAVEAMVSELRAAAVAAIRGLPCAAADALLEMVDLLVPRHTPAVNIREHAGVAPGGRQAVRGAA